MLMGPDASILTVSPLNAERLLLSGVLGVEAEATGADSSMGERSSNSSSEYTVTPPDVPYAVSKKSGLVGRSSWIRSPPISTSGAEAKAFSSMLAARVEWVGVRYSSG